MLAEHTLKCAVCGKSIGTIQCEVRTITIPDGEGGRPALTAPTPTRKQLDENRSLCNSCVGKVPGRSK